MAAVCGTLIYFVTKPARSDTCSSEILTNGQGISVNLSTKVIQAGAKRDKVKLDSITNQSALIIDGLSRLCRERQDQLISDIEYRRRFNALLAPLVFNVQAPSSRLPLFEGDMDMIGWDGNEKLITFLEKNDRKVVQIKGDMDFTRSSGSEPMLKDCVGDDDYPKDNNPFNKQLPLPRNKMDDRGNPPADFHSFCYNFAIVVRTNQAPDWSSGGTGVLTFDITGFYRVKVALVSAQTIYYLTAVPATASDFVD